MKILHVLTGPKMEGTPRLVLDWLTLENIEQEVLFLSAAGGLKDEFEKKGVWQYYNTSFDLGLKNAFQIINLVRKISRERKPDIVISWPMGFSQWITIGARMGGAKKVLVHNGNPPGQDFFKKYLYTYLTFYLGKFFGNKIVACSHSVKAEYTRIPGIPARWLHVVHNAFQFSKFSLPESFDLRRKNEVSMVAYLESARDHSTLLRAWKIVGEKYPDIRLNIIGDGSLRRELEELTAELLLKNVNFTGKTDNVARYYHQTKVYVFSTRYEGFGITLLEALAAGCQVVATDVPACREVLSDGRYGTLVEKQNPTAMAEAIMKKLSSSINQEELDRQISYVQRFTTSNMVEGYLSVANAK